eukprot:CAMPEP_0195524612 /NCGR_PEP_ID=MMETSP0794_2-20130614/24532_1 /TAXON_ID=515487 /ORGANISM="Stephanopyxis turris, Strain CCMP 815" /LENGTH=259 /DNA_ID=CAMNT_0040654865 /DNA_START=44 /DNA_END=823 /DNA_ORIENTATION=+
MLSRVIARAVSRRVPVSTRRSFLGCRGMADNAVTKRDEEDQAEIKVYTTEEKIKRQRQNTLTSPLNRDLFIPDDQLAAIEDGEEGILAGSRDYKAYEGRLATIARPAQHAMTSGTYKFRHWRVTFDHQESWTNHLMGWNSSADSLQQLNLKFETKEQAMKFCERQGIKFIVEDPLEKDDFKGKKDYGDNFLSKLNQSRIAKHGEAHFAYDETHHQSHWANLECNKFGQTTWEQKEKKWIDKFAGGKYEPQHTSHDFPSA